MSKKNQDNGSTTFIFLALFMLIFLTCGTRKRDGAKCWDGTRSYATGRGACSHHGGVRNWTYEYWWEDL